MGPLTDHGDYIESPMRTHDFAVQSVEFLVQLLVVVSAASLGPVVVVVAVVSILIAAATVAGATTVAGSESPYEVDSCQHDHLGPVLRRCRRRRVVDYILGSVHVGRGRRRTSGRGSPPVV